MELVGNQHGHLTTTDLSEGTSLHSMLANLQTMLVPLAQHALHSTPCLKMGQNVHSAQPPNTANTSKDRERHNMQCVWQPGSAHPSRPVVEPVHKRRMMWMGALDLRKQRGSLYFPEDSTCRDHWLLPDSLDATPWQRMAPHAHMASHNRTGTCTQHCTGTTP